jgi:hypothetical protein
MIVVPIVEGDGEIAAVRVLIAKCNPDLEVSRPIRVRRDRLIKPDYDEFTRALSLAHQKLGGNDGVVLVLLDSEGSCPGAIAGDLAMRAAESHGHVRVFVVIAHTMYESWFAASAETLSGKNGLRADLVPPADPELCRKSWINDQLPENRCYNEPRDQPKLTALIDLNLAAQRSRSFRKLLRVLKN